MPSGQFIAPEHWNQSRQVVRKSSPNREGVEQALRQKRSEIEQLQQQLLDLV
ncbi:MAG: Arm DNA-binding domain-containing protein [Flavobacteriales bacterium]